MRKFQLFLAVIAAAIFASCNPEEEVKVNPIYFESFAFMAEDHSGFMSEDIVFNNLKTTSEINVLLPMGTILDSLTHMSPRFTLPAEDIVVTYGDGEDAVIVEGDGKDSLDFSAPVDLYMTNGKDYFKYTVNVQVTPNNWELINTHTVDLYNDIQVAYDNANDQFYILSAMKGYDADGKASSSLNYPVLYKFKNGEFSNVTNQKYGALTDERASGVCGVTVLNNDVYVSFQDYGAPTSQTITTMKVSNGTATILGDRGAIYKTNTMSRPLVFPFANNNVWVATSIGNSKGEGTMVRYDLNLSKFDGTSWSNGNAVEGRQSGIYAYALCSAIVNGNAYLLVENQNHHSVSIYKNAGGAGWTSLAEDMGILRADNQYTNTDRKLSYYIDFAVSANEELFILAQTQNDNENYSLSLIKFDPATKTQTIVGGVIPNTNTTNGGVEPELAISPAGVPYVVYANNVDKTDRLYVTYIDSKTKTWITPEPVNDVESLKPVILFDKNGKGYVFARVQTADKKKLIHVYGMKK